ncbi:MAG: hypothetical protein ACLQDV_23705 [Candidatus Binataceae bacterium]
MKKAAFLIFVLEVVLSSCASTNTLAKPPEAPAAAAVSSNVFWLVGSDLETHNPVAIVGLAQVAGDRITGKATVNDGGRVCDARISGMVNATPDGSQDAIVTLSSEDGRCPSPLEFRGVISRSVFAVIEVDSKLVTAGAAWRQ